MHCDHMQDPEIIITEIDEQLFLFVIEEILITAPDFLIMYILILQ